MVEARFRPLAVDASRYTVEDAAGTVRSAVPRWRWILEGVDEVPHGTIVALDALADVLRAAGGSGDTIDELVDPVNRRLSALSREVGPSTPFIGAVQPHDPLASAVEGVDGLLSAAARTVVVERVGSQRGTIDRVNASRGGVPKAAVTGAEVTMSGLAGDRQRVRRHHGRPSQALSLWSTEVIDALAAEGHPVGAGGAGENLTVSGLDWSALRPGVRLLLGGSAVAELTGWADPCSNIAGSFTGGRFQRIDHERHPGWSRAYAAVVAGGTVRPGDEVRVLP